MPSLFSFSKERKLGSDPNVRRFELVLLFAIGLTLGILGKGLAVRSFTIGFDDYRIRPMENAVDLNRAEQDTISKRSPIGLGSSGSGATCAP